MAHAMVEAVHVENCSVPCSFMGSEPLSEEAVGFIRDTGFVSAGSPLSIEESHCHHREVKRCRHSWSGSLEVMEIWQHSVTLQMPMVLLSLEDQIVMVEVCMMNLVGSMNLPVLVMHGFLNIAQPIWHSAFQDITNNFVNETSYAELQQILKLYNTQCCKGVSSCRKDMIELCESSWLTDEKWQNDELEASRLKLSNVSIC
ncbi:uncharacterized protein LOC131153308 [Malania oleifera]|uniref:uncharacterized protein LOC131153308 n=1 Tax=Malania oleifera TaxID=397392 RepID=UPI0025AE639F|nr:uncharacterized protein LOC131153308 [Malania oleifera]XP_057961506.1 uncharacterized protein LOC131153308 [Malania oleifera]